MKKISIIKKLNFSFSRCLWGKTLKCLKIRAITIKTYNINNFISFFGWFMEH